MNNFLLVFTDDYHAIASDECPWLSKVRDFLARGMSSNLFRVLIISEINRYIVRFLVAEEVGFRIYVILETGMPIEVFRGYHHADRNMRTERGRLKLEVSQLPDQPIILLDLW